MAKAVISSTYDDKYLFFLPIVTYCWNKLGVDVICFLPIEKNDKDYAKIKLAMEYCNNYKLSVYQFAAPEHKEATYAQCSRLYAACLDLPEDEILVTSDVDMAVFKLPPHETRFTIFGYDLVPQEQYPMCYASASVKEWRSAFCQERMYQQCLDNLVGVIECEHFRGNQWSLDQSELFRKLTLPRIINIVPRARPYTQFALNRYDRDDAFLLDRLSLDTIDYHMPRPGYLEQNFNQILTVLKFHYPLDDFDWLINYREQYISLL